jgi:hypothetical protein
MESNSSEISFEYLPIGKKGKVQMLVHMPGATFSDKFDITDSDRRERFVKKLLKRHPGLNEQDIRSELERISSEIVGHAIHQEREPPPYIDEDERDKAQDGKDVDLRRDASGHLERHRGRSHTTGGRRGSNPRHSAWEAGSVRGYLRAFEGTRGHWRALEDHEQVDLRVLERV